MWNRAAIATRQSKLLAIARLSVVVLLAKVFFSILLEYQRYFPADFEATFLIGRRETFTTVYASAFYIHIVSGPLTVLLGTWQMWSGTRTRFRALHRWAGRMQMLLIFGALVPSGLVMAPRAFAGPIAGYGFAALSLTTAISAAVTVFYAISRRFALHKRWATRTYILLISPLLLRLVSGGLIVTQLESDWAYRLNAWFSWIVPLIVYEAWWRFGAGYHRQLSQKQLHSFTNEAVS